MPSVNMKKDLIGSFWDDPENAGGRVTQIQDETITSVEPRVPGEASAKPGTSSQPSHRPKVSAVRMSVLPSSARRPSPADDLGVNALARFGAPPIVIPPMAKERKRIRADMILAKELEDPTFRSFSIAGKRIQPRLSSCHFRLCGRDVINLEAMARGILTRAPPVPECVLRLHFST